MDAAAFLATVRGAVDARLREFLAGRVEEARRLGPATGAVAETVADLTMRGGKRLRAAFVAAGARVAGEKIPSPGTITIGAAVEIFQAYLLIHDDWMDGDESRRGGPTAHVALGRRLGEEHSAVAAVLAGDLASAWSRTLLGDTRSVWSHQEERVVLGQILDVFGGAPPSLVVTLKTTSYTVLMPLLLGLGTGPAFADRAPFLAYAHHVGEAFQLRDDLLGLVGDPAETGKPVGTDLLRGKRTPPVIDALDHGDDDARAAIEAVLGHADAPAAHLRAAIDALVSCGAVERAERRIHAALEHARGDLAAAYCDDEAKDLLVGLARLAAERTK